jgi:hypothetical protein
MRNVITCECVKITGIISGGDRNDRQMNSDLPVIKF